MSCETAQKKGAVSQLRVQHWLRGNTSAFYHPHPPLSLPVTPDLVHTPCHCVPSTGLGLAPDKLSILMSQPALASRFSSYCTRTLHVHIPEELYLEAGSFCSPVSDRRSLHHERSNIERSFMPNIKGLFICCALAGETPALWASSVSMPCKQAV